MPFLSALGYDVFDPRDPRLRPRAQDVFYTRARARTVITDYIENYYNNTRRHSYLDYLSPLKYELRAT
jgi:transposase InsO family protein